MRYTVPEHATDHGCKASSDQEDVDAIAGWWFVGFPLDWEEAHVEHSRKAAKQRAKQQNQNQRGWLSTVRQSKAQHFPHPSAIRRSTERDVVCLHGHHACTTNDGTIDTQQRQNG